MAAPGRERPKHAVAAVEELPPGQHKVVSIGRREIGIFNIDGKLYGLPNLCPHQGGPLCTAPWTYGTLIATQDSAWKPVWSFDGEVVACPWHGIEYHVPTGQCLAFPEISLRSYQVTVEDGQIYVHL